MRASAIVQGAFGAMTILVVPVAGALLVATAGCGGKLLVLPSASIAADAATGDDGASAPGSDGASVYGGSSSGYGAVPSQEDGASSSGDGSSGLPHTYCGSASDCTQGLVCCADSNLATSCLPGPCPPAAPTQFCATATECLVRTDVCVHLISEPEDSYMACTPPMPAPAGSH